jgi:SanA protein
VLAHHSEDGFGENLMKAFRSSRFMKIIKRLCIFIAVVFLISITLIFAINAMIYIKTKPYIYNKTSNIPHAQTVIILGAAVLPNRNLSPVLKDRVDTAIQLYESKKVSKILVSGANSTVAYNEVNPVRTYLLSKGVFGQDIFLDHAGFDTYSTMYRARDIFKVNSALIVSQSFHLPRAVFIARKLGLNAYGVNADSGHILFINYIREVFADEKAVLSLMFNVKPKFLGASIPITGNGGNNL